MKFDSQLYWKHENCKDAFFCASKVVFDEDGYNAIISGTWCVQGNSRWWFALDGRIKITPKEYDKWKRYTPKGQVLL